MPQYRVMKANWLTDSRGAAALRQVGDCVDLSERQAAYLIRSGQIAPMPTKPAATGTRTSVRGKTTPSTESDS